MAKFIITVDSSCDCDLMELKQKNIDVIYFSYQDEKNVYKDTMDINGYKKFYDDVRGGKVYKTSQINPQEYYDFFKNLLKENLPIIHVSLGSGLSNTINSIFIAISMLKEEYENVDIRPIDSKIASLGLMLLINKLVEYRDNNISVDEAYIKTQDFEKSAKYGFVGKFVASLYPHHKDRTVNDGAALHDACGIAWLAKPNKNRLHD